jgi:release factor H-coupled RctB family protein
MGNEITNKNINKIKNEIKDNAKNKMGNEIINKTTNKNINKTKNEIKDKTKNQMENITKNEIINKSKDKLTIITDDKLWMEGTAVNQAYEVCKLDGVERVFAMPDLHAGKTPVGVVVVTKGKIYPHLIGTDIGCGMSLFSTGVEAKKVKVERWVARLNTIKTLAVVPNTEYFFDCPIPDFGSIGSGNHFAEFQEIREVYDADELSKLAMDRDELFITVHSGSRSYGSKILREFGDYGGYDICGGDTAGIFDISRAYNKRGDKAGGDILENSRDGNKRGDKANGGILENSRGDDSRCNKAMAYMKKHDDALMWAEKNRLEVAKKLLNYLGFSQTVEKKLECGHNFLEESGGLYYHRKGVVSAKNGAVLIAGSRGTLSYIVKPTAKCVEYGFSLAHGSGRKWTRSMCKSRIREKYTLETIKRNKFGGQLVCHDYDLLFEEAPDAYKNVETVIAALEKYGMIEKIAAVRPVLTFKG